MKFALYGLHRGSNVDPDILQRRAELAEQAGFESLWVGDHIAVEAGIDDDDPRLEALTALSFLAAVTTRVRLGVGVLVLPQRQPVLAAKQLTTIDHLSRGRLMVGIGIGWNGPELAAFGVTPDERVDRTTEHLDALKASWESTPVSFHGPTVAFDNLVQRPAPMQQPHPPLVFGGHTNAALRRAAEHGHGWFGWDLNPDECTTWVKRLREIEQHHRTPNQSPVEVTVLPGTPLDIDTIAAYERSGVNRLVLQPGTTTSDDIDNLIAAAATTVTSFQEYAR